MEIELKIQHQGWEAVSALCSVNGEDKSGRQVEIPNANARIAFDGALVFKSFGAPEITQFVITYGPDVVTGIVAAWMYDKLFAHKDKIEKIELDRRIVNLDKGEITQIIDEHITYEKR